MAGIIKFDSSLKPETPTIVLMKKNGDRLGLIENTSNFHFSDNMDSADEFSFTVHKKYNGYVCSLWDEILDFRVVYIREYDKYFEGLVIKPVFDYWLIELILIFEDNYLKKIFDDK